MRPPSSDSASRRTFLKGVGIAGAAGFAAPLLSRSSASAATGLVLGANSGAWIPPTTPPTPGWASKVAHALGCRSYRDDVLSTGTDVRKLNGFPGVKGTKVVASIKPNPNVLLNPSHPNHRGLVDALYALILNGATSASNGHFAGSPQLTVWHEAGFLYLCTPKDTTWCKYGISRGQANAAQRVRSMHVTMKAICDHVAMDHPRLPRVEYGCIIYGNVDEMASETDSTQNFVPTASHPMDWYGVDVYYEDDGQGSLCTHGTLSSFDLVSQYLDGFRSLAHNRGGSGARMNITECNASLAHDSSRPRFFENLALWLHNNGGYRMLTFFPTDKPGNHSVTWQHVADAGTNDNTIRALDNIQNTYG